MGSTACQRQHRFEKTDVSNAHSSDWVVHEQFFSLYDQMIGESSLPHILHQVTNVVAGVLHAEGATVYLYRPETEELEAHVVVGNVPRTIHIPVRETSLSGYCALVGEAFLVRDAYDDLSYIDPKIRFDRSWDQIHGFRTRDVICAPAILKGEIVGVVQVLNSLERPFDQSDVAALRSVARLVGYALYHARLYDDLANMKQLQKEKAKFMRVMVHELKSPLSAARMLLDLVRKNRIGEVERERVLSRIASRIDGMQELITDTMALSGAAIGDVLGEVAVVDLSRCLLETCADYRDDCESKNLRLKINIPKQSIKVRIDTKGLRLILSNLLSNAVKYTPSGSVEVSLDTEDDHTVVSVKDTGIGIPEEDIPKLFREFYRASNARAAKLAGTGVGLAGVKCLVERFGGTLRFETKENVGSTFSVVLKRCS